LFICFSLAEQIDNFDDYFAIVSLSPACARAQVGFALVLSLVEKLSISNCSLCLILLQLIKQIIERASQENRSFLVDIGLTQVLFNTLSSAISRSHNDLIVAVQQCFNSLIVHLFTTNVTDDVSFVVIINNIIAIIMIHDEPIDTGRKRSKRKQ
jgi:hypothetical protein